MGAEYLNRYGVPGFTRDATLDGKSLNTRPLALFRSCPEEEDDRCCPPSQGEKKKRRKKTSSGGAATGVYPWNGPTLAADCSQLQAIKKERPPVAGPFLESSSFPLSNCPRAALDSTFVHSSSAPSRMYAAPLGKRSALWEKRTNCYKVGSTVKVSKVSSVQHYRIERAPFPSPNHQQLQLPKQGLISIESD